MAQRRKSLSEKDIQTMIAIISSIEQRFPNDADKNTFIGSMTIDEMHHLERKLKDWMYGKKDADDEMWDYDDYSSNAPCDTYGMCAGSSCSHYYECHK